MNESSSTLLVIIVSELKLEWLQNLSTQKVTSVQKSHTAAFFDGPFSKLVWVSLLMRVAAEHKESYKKKQCVCVCVQYWRQGELELEATSSPFLWMHYTSPLKSKVDTIA